MVTVYTLSSFNAQPNVFYLCFFAISAAYITAAAATNSLIQNMQYSQIYAVLTIGLSGYGNELTGSNQ